MLHCLHRTHARVRAGRRRGRRVALQKSYIAIGERAAILKLYFYEFDEKELMLRAEFNSCDVPEQFYSVLT